jgi:four helix bundle protein
MNNKPKYDLEERTSKLGEKTIKFCKTIKENNITNPLIKQLIRSSTSVGANYAEANGASSKKDFKNKIYICKKEIQETKHWFRMISTAYPMKKDDARKLWSEAQELTLIFQKIINSCNKKDKNEN